MTGTVTFVGTYSIPLGRFEEWAAAITDMTDFVSSTAERLISFDTYVNAEQTEGTTIYLHPDTESLEQHMRLAAGRISEGSQMVEVSRIELYGSPSEAIVRMLRETSTGYPVTVKRHFYGSQPRNRSSLGSNEAGASP